MFGGKGLIYESDNEMMVCGPKVNYARSLTDTGSSISIGGAPLTFSSSVSMSLYDVEKQGQLFDKGPLGKQPCTPYSGRIIEGRIREEVYLYNKENDMWRQAWSEERG
jgi:hypothetical protein